MMTSTEPTLVPAEDDLDERLIWIGDDDRGIRLEIVAVVLVDVVVVIQVMPTAFRGPQ